MAERMTQDNLVAAWDDGRRGEIWDELVRARESEMRLIGYLRQISEGRGPFSLDQLQFAANTIEAMKSLANEALAAAGVGND